MSSPLQTALLNWYQANARRLPWRENVTPYRVWVSEIMLQQTRVEAARAYFLRFMEALPTVSALAEAQEEQLLKLWEGLGYYSRVRNMKKAAVLLTERYHGVFPSSYEALRQLPGIGDYTAGAIASIAFSLPVPAVDGNVLRVLSRIYALSDDISQEKNRKKFRSLAQQLLPVSAPGAFNQALMELGATICLPNSVPQCLICPAAPQCRAYHAGNPQDYPVKAAKAKRRRQDKTVCVLVSDGKIYLEKRPAKGLLAGLWQFWNTDGTLSRKEALEKLHALGAAPVRIKTLGKSKHVFTHIEWHMQGYLAFLETPCPLGGGAWATLRELEEDYAIASAFSSFKKALLENLKK